MQQDELEKAAEVADWKWGGEEREAVLGVGQPGVGVGRSMEVVGAGVAHSGEGADTA